MKAIFREGRLVTTAAIGVRDGRFFVARRKDTGSQALRWEFPGGKCDADCDERSCLARELLEEFGVSVDVGDELGSVTFDHEGTPYILVGYRVEIPQVPLVLREHSEAGWFFPDELLQLDLSDSDRTLFYSIQNAIGS